MVTLLPLSFTQPTKMSPLGATAGHAPCTPEVALMDCALVHVTPASVDLSAQIRLSAEKLVKTM